MPLRNLLIWLGCLALPGPVLSGEAVVAVAANFLSTLNALAISFEQTTGHRIRTSSGSTGKLYAQITHGAPYDVFLAADRERPARLYRHGLAGRPFTYASGRLVLFTRKQELSPSADSLSRMESRRLAIANPKTAPYGRAALEVLRNLGLYPGIRRHLVFGDSIMQAYQFVATGNVDFGLVALSQTRHEPAEALWRVPKNLHRPIHQDAVLLTRGQDMTAARAFIAFLTSRQARDIIASHGYDLPPDSGQKSEQ